MIDCGGPSLPIKKKKKKKKKLKTENKKNIIQKKKPTKLSRPMSAKSYQKLFYSKRKKNLKLPYLVTRLYIKRNRDFFESPLKTFPLEITILAVVELIEKVEKIKKTIRTWGCGT